MVVCNYMGKPYTFTGEDDLPISTSGATGKYIVKINPVQIGEMCTSIPMAKTCESSTCWKRGTINGGDGSKQITAGVNVISRISAGPPLKSGMPLRRPILRAPATPHPSGRIRPRNARARTCGCDAESSRAACCEVSARRPTRLGD
jgi:hypothetical protein